MKCPNCRKVLTLEHLRESEECSKYIASLAGMLNASKRKSPPKAGPGRPKKKPTV